MKETGPTATEIEKALYGRRKGSRIDVSPPEERTCDGIVFHSKHEMEVYQGFARLLKAETIKELELQVPYPLHCVDPHGRKVPICKWVADFVIIEHSGRRSVYDAKGYRTEMYRLKKKWAEAEHGIHIIEL